MDKYRYILPRPKGARRNTISKLKPLFTNTDPTNFSHSNVRQQNLQTLANVNLSKKSENSSKEYNRNMISSLLNDIGQSHTPRRITLPPVSKSVSLGDIPHMPKVKKTFNTIKYSHSKDDMLDAKPTDIKKRQLPKLENINIKEKLKEFWMWHEEHKRKAQLVQQSHLVGISQRSRDLVDLENSALFADHPNAIKSPISQFDKTSTNSKPLRQDSPAAKLSDPLLYRDHTMMTWQTWRDINDSDAYDDVQSYITENRLLPNDKKNDITQWIDSVSVSTQVTYRTQ